MAYDSVQYPALTRPIDPSGYVEPVFLDGWLQPASQPVRAVEYRYSLPSVFFVGEPDDFTTVTQVIGWEQPISQPVLTHPDLRHQYPSTFAQIDPADFVEPVFFDGWYVERPNPVIPVENRHAITSVFAQIDPADFEVAFSTFGWEQPIGQPLEQPPEFRFVLPSVFAPDYERIISSDDGVNFAAWVQPISQPVLPVEYRYLLPDIFVWIDENDFSVVVGTITVTLQSRSQTATMQSRSMTGTLDSRSTTLTITGRPG